MKIAIAQVNCTVGDITGNSAKLREFAERARAAGATLMLGPELALSGYPPEDLLLRPDFYQSCARALAALAEWAHDIALVVGHPHEAGGKRYNAASLLRDGRIAATYLKHRLPNYTVFDEQRYFSAGDQPCVFEHEGVRFGINICADIWEDLSAMRARQAGAHTLLVLNASPYHMRKQRSRYEVVRDRIAETGMPVIYANLVGGQDELVFDGGSFVMNPAGATTHQFAVFEEVLGLVELDDNGVPDSGVVAPILSLEAEVWSALCLGVKDYISKNGFPGALIGLSGGMDSALTLAIAVDALGANRVHAVMMPSSYTADMSFADARAMARSMAVNYSEISITALFESFRKSLADEFAGYSHHVPPGSDTTEENLQSRIRGVLLMALSNKTGYIVLNTGNKSESGTGYATLYGDMVGGFAVLKDISKTLVYKLGHYRNGLSKVIPDRVIERAPSAELKPDQTDQDTLPPYAALDGIMEAFVEHDLGPSEIVARGYAKDDVAKVVRLIAASEYKRRQGPPGIRITPRGFGKDWRYPITNKYRHAL
ncbi:MAG: NAD+ synthase [Burkholderiales bacterium]|nr:NAD+ synthase [Burkholderiales bacterium]